jgi:prolyl-tRNA synthetase
LKFSQLLIKTAKEAPKDAVLPSHKYLIQGGFINQVGAGIYNFLPMGKIVLDKIRKVVKTELDSAGCNEVLLGFVTPAELWEQSGRLGKYGKELLRFKDRKESEFVLGPTHEEMMVELAKNSINSYKQLPVNLYQIHTKFRDEARPRFGLLRGREFVMKDGYSFHEDEASMKAEFLHMQKTYAKIFTKLGLDFRIVEADSGAIGGSGSKEFMVLADSGEDTIVVCESCDYAANIEAAKRAEPKHTFNKEFEYAQVATPDTASIEEVAAFFEVETSQTIKAVIKKALYDEHEAIVVFFVRGSDELEETKACNAVNANELLDASEGEIAEAHLIAGYTGLDNLVKSGVTFVIDQELKSQTNLITGSNKEGYHTVGFSLEDLDASYDDLIAVQEGDLCACCAKEDKNSTLRYTKGIEVGHIFQLGTRYSEPLEANFLDQNGKSCPFVMGTYGIGVSRLLSAVIEQHHDEKGCIWSPATAPFSVCIIVSNAKKDEELQAGIKIYEALKEAGIDTVLDDRKDARFGFKMRDFELIGFPYGIIVGKSLQEGIVEIVDRKTLQKEPISLENLKENIIQKIAL